MSTKALIDRIMPYASGWSRSTGNRSILKLIEQGQDELFDFDAPYMKYLGTDNEGFPPYLKTVDGTYKYDITAANLSATSLVKNIGGTDYSIRCKKVTKVFVDISYNTEYGIRWIGAPYVFYLHNPYTTNVNRTMVADVPVDSWPALEDTSAYVIFKENPGTHNTRYFVEFIWEPPRLTSENIPLAVPREYERALYRYVIEEIGWKSNGLDSDSSKGFDNYWVPKFQSMMTTGAHSYELKVQTRTC